MTSKESEQSDDDDVHRRCCAGAPPPQAPANTGPTSGSVLERKDDKPPGTDQSGLAQKHDSAGGNNPQQRYPHSKSFNLFSSCGITCLKFYKLLKLKSRASETQKDHPERQDAPQRRVPTKLETSQQTIEHIMCAMIKHGFGWLLEWLINLLAPELLSSIAPFWTIVLILVSVWRYIRQQKPLNK